MLVLAHISDTHFDGGRRNLKRAQRVMNYINALPGPIDAIVVTGDVADDGSVEEYEQARSVFRSEIPIVFCPGNHDERQAFRSVLLDEDGTGPVNQVHTFGDTVIALCDSSIPGGSDGELSDETLDWLRQAFADAPAEANIIVAFHHPPVILHSPIIDPIRLRDADALAAIIAAEPRVIAILCGHAHTAAVTTFAGVPVIVAPSVASVLGPVWEGNGTSHDPVVDYGANPALAFHVIDDGRITTHFRSVAKPGAGKGRGYLRSHHR